MRLRLTVSSTEGPSVAEDSRCVSYSRTYSERSQMYTIHTDQLVSDARIRGRVQTL